MTRRYLLDTGPAFYLLFRRRGVELGVEEARPGGSNIGISLPGLAERAAGLEASESREASWEIARRRLGKAVCWLFDEPAYEYGRIFAEVKRRGRIIQQIDMMIAAIARSLGNCVVVSSDSDLSAVPGLAVENWAS